MDGAKARGAMVQDILWCLLIFFFVNKDNWILNGFDFVLVC
jgi:hypothetical protein